MASSSPLPLVAVDIGNSRIKLGDFEPPFTEPLPHPGRALAVGHDWTDQDLEKVLSRDPAEYAWTIASVNRPAAMRLADWLQQRKVSQVRFLTHEDLPLVIVPHRPDLVGMDRLVNAVAANRLRAPDQPVLVVDFGSAITVDLVSETGAFAGGAILAGIAMSARALHEFTDLVPLVEVTEAPAALGTSTLTAVSSGLYWGAVGAVRELIARLAGPLEPRVLLTGGGAPEFAAILSEDQNVPTQFVPHLTLAGIALTTLIGPPAKGAR